jgi:hypothetical protein
VKFSGGVFYVLGAVCFACMGKYWFMVTAIHGLGLFVAVCESVWG